MTRIVCFMALALACLSPLRASEADASIACANLIYAGTRSSVCFSDRFLSIVSQQSAIVTARRFTPVKLADDEVYRYPFAVMTGEGAFALTAAERVNLKRYLERGGFLLASAGCSSSQWAGSFEREMEQIFPERPMQEIPLSHELFHTLDDIDSLATQGPPATLRGLSLGGKLVVVYSSDGLNDTGSMHGCCCCGGNEIKNSQQINANILAYALVQ